MKKSWVTFFLWPLLLANQCFAQLDTLYFEDFVDNRHQWTEFDNETGSLGIRGGMLECKVIQAKSRIRFTYLNVPLPVADTFVYEIRMVFDSVRLGGAIYDINHLTNKRTQKQNLCCYDAMVAHRKGIYCYQYFNGDGHHDSFWTKRRGEMNRGAHTFPATTSDQFFARCGVDWVDYLRQNKPIFQNVPIKIQIGRRPRSRVCSA